MLSNTCGTSIVAKEIILLSHPTNVNRSKIHAVNPTPIMVEVSHKTQDTLGASNT